MARSAAAGLRRDMRPNADFLTVTSIVASLLLGTPHSALMILALSDLAELMTPHCSFGDTVGIFISLLLSSSEHAMNVIAVIKLSNEVMIICLIFILPVF